MKTRDALHVAAFALLVFAGAWVSSGCARRGEAAAAVPTPRPAPAVIGPQTAPETQPPQVEVQSMSPTTAANPRLAVPLGIGVYALENVTFFNAYAEAQDVLAVRPQVLDLLADASVGQKMLVLGPRDVAENDLASLIASAKAEGVTSLGYNLETSLPLAELLGQQSELQAFALDQGLLYAFGPTLTKLTSYYAEFAARADIIVLQSQRYQTSAGYETQVETLIEKIRAANPAVQVWVQISLNPPEKADISPQDVLLDIYSIADSADLIWLFFSPQRTAVMEEVFRQLRPLEG